MTTSADDHREAIQTLDDDAIEEHLIEESGLNPTPEDPHGGDLDLALMHAAADEAPPHLFQAWVRKSPHQAPNDAPHIAPVVAGTIGLARLVTEGQDDHLDTLRSLASDPRWRVREAVVMALNRLAQQDPKTVLATVESWAIGSPLEQRAAIATLTTPALIQDDARAKRALDALDTVTENLHEAKTHDDEGLIALRETLGIAWAPAIAAHPKQGKPLFETWLPIQDPNIRWVIKNNLQQPILQDAEPAWAQRTLERLTETEPSNR